MLFFINISSETFVYLLFNCVLILSASAFSTPGKHKRHLFRENVLPQFGGKIPESAFIPDRISLNRLNQNGFYTTDGFYLQQRQPDRQHGPKQLYPSTIKVSVGSGHQFRPNTIDTTYLIREPTKQYSISPPKFPHYYLPVLPQHSLKLIRRHKSYKQFGKLNNFSTSSPSTSLGVQIFNEFRPLIQKLIENDYF